MLLLLFAALLCSACSLGNSSSAIPSSSAVVWLAVTHFNIIWIPINNTYTSRIERSSTLEFISIDYIKA